MVYISMINNDEVTDCTCGIPNCTHYVYIPDDTPPPPGAALRVLAVYVCCMMFLWLMFATMDYFGLIGW